MVRSFGVGRLAARFTLLLEQGEAVGSGVYLDAEFMLALQGIYLSFMLAVLRIRVHRSSL
jgi:hypothetical protein